MPEISRFFGIVIAMFYNEHNPPHFHARYGEHKVEIDIQTLSVLAGKFPPRAMGLVIDWASRHQDELMADSLRGSMQNLIELNHWSESCFRLM